MHEFENSWLLSREKIDSISRNKKAIEKINKYTSISKNLNIIDLGCGTGSNFRYLNPKIVKKQSWKMVDISHLSLSYLKKNIKHSQKIQNITYKKIDIIKQIEKIDFKNFDIVTGSALLDIMPKEWFINFLNINKSTKIIYFTINYDGNFKFYPKHKDDDNIVRLFNQDQMSDKGIGKKAVGPKCTQIIDQLFQRTHKTYVFNSNWVVEKNKNMQKMFISFCEDIISKNKKNYEDWLNYRKEKIKSNKSILKLQNKDFLALKL